MHGKLVACVLVSLFVVIAPTIGAEQTVGVEINSLEITDVSINPSLNISYFDRYNFTVTVNSSVPVHTVEWHKEFIDGQNASNNNTHYYVNGTKTERANPYGYHENLTYTENNGTYNIYQRPDQLYPVITFGLNREIWNNVPQNIPIWQQNYQIFHFENPFDLTDNTTLFYEFNAEPNSVSPPASQTLSVYIVEKNHTIDFFETNEWWLNESVELMKTFTYHDTPNHVHTANSSHYLVPMSTNDDYTIGMNHLDVTDDFWVVLMCNANSIGRGWTLKWHGTEIDNNTAHWYTANRQALTTIHHDGVPDTHVHIVRRDGITDGIKVSFKVTNALGEVDYSNNSFYFIPENNYPPNPTEFITPTTGIYSGEVNISWYVCNDPNIDDVYYTLNIFGCDGEEHIFIKTIVENITETYYIWNTTEIEDGIYDLQIIASDGILSSNFMLSHQDVIFEIDNIPPPTIFEVIILIIVGVAPVVVVFILIRKILLDVKQVNEEK